MDRLYQIAQRVLLKEESLHSSVYSEILFACLRREIAVGVCSQRRFSIIDNIQGRAKLIPNKLIR
jgi:hypothetical protein